MDRLRLPWPGWVTSTWDSVRTGYWFLPSTMALAAGIAAQGLLELDRRVPPEWIDWMPWVFAASAEGVRTVLNVVAGSMITVTGVVFSITIVALTLASNQFGPRLLRNFMRDRVNQFVLGTFLATFLYSLLVLRSVQAHDDVAFVPHIATSGAVALGVASLFVLILFIHHAATSIQASSVIAAVAQEVRAGIPELFPESMGEAAEELEGGPLRDQLRREGRVIRSNRAGYVRVIDGATLLDLASQLDAQVAIERRAGDFAVEGAPLAWVRSPAELSESQECAIQDAFVLGDHRTPVQDLLFPVEQLSEMAVRALSSGVNDPRTAVACVHRLGDVLATLSERADPSPCRRDEAGMIRIVATPTRFQDVLLAGIDPIRRYGAGDPTVCVALLEALGEAVKHGARGERLEQIRQCAADIFSAAAEEIHSKRDLARVEEAMADLEEELAELS